MTEETAHLKERGPNTHGLCCQTAPGGHRSSRETCWGLSPLLEAKRLPPRPNTQTPSIAVPVGGCCRTHALAGVPRATLGSPKSQALEQNLPQPTLAPSGSEPGAEPQHRQGKQHLFLACTLPWLA